MFNSNAKSARPVEPDEKFEIRYLKPLAFELAKKDDEETEEILQAIRVMRKATREKLNVQR